MPLHKLGDIHVQPYGDPDARYVFVGYEKNRYIRSKRECMACRRYTNHLWDLERRKVCVICGVEDWVPIGADNRKGWASMYFHNLQWFFCPKHADLGHEMEVTIALTVEAEARDFLEAVVERVAKQEGQTKWAMDYGRQL